MKKAAMVLAVVLIAGTAFADGGYLTGGGRQDDGGVLGPGGGRIESTDGGTLGSGVGRDDGGNLGSGCCRTEDDGGLIGSGVGSQDGYFGSGHNVRRRGFTLDRGLRFLALLFGEDAYVFFD